MNISFEGINESIVTFAAEGNIEPGNLVTVCNNNTVKKSTDNANFIGICLSCSNGLAAVQISGFATIKIKSMESTNFGIQYFVADNDACLKPSSNENKDAVPLNVVAIDKEAATIDVFL